MNEPRLVDDFDMNKLKAFYAAGIRAVRESSGGKMTAMIHGEQGDTLSSLPSYIIHSRLLRRLSLTSRDAFWGPSYWRNYDPNSPTSYGYQPVNYVVIDTHQYYAFPPLQGLSQGAILESVCNVSKLLKGTQGLGRTVVGEWSLETGESPAESRSPASCRTDIVSRS